MADAEVAFYVALLEDDPDELYERAPCAYLSSLPDGTIVKVNATFLSWSGYQREELVGRRRFQELLAPGDRIFYETHYAPLLRMQGRVREIAVELVCAGGARLPLLLNSVLKVDSDGQPVVVRTAAFDASERRAYERELLAARERAVASEARARALAETLQASFIPPLLPTVPGVELGATYRPAGDGTQVGGDFYDVFETAPGPWAVVVGDVCGKGPPAAVVTSLARHTVRAEALRTASPSAVLATLHDALLRYHPSQYCTALLATVVADADGVRFTVSSGGHHLPHLLGADGQRRVLGRPGTLVGLVNTVDRVDQVERLAEGDVVALFTDGVTEARDQGELFGEERLWESLAELRDQPAQEIADGLVQRVLEFQHGDARDDIAVVILKVPS